MIEALNKYNLDNNEMLNSIEAFKELFELKLSKPLFYKMGFKNFKAFGDKLQTFSIKPITLIYAPNSVGKSSFMHNIIHLHYFLENHLNTKNVSLDKIDNYGDEIDLGGFESYIHKRNLNNHIYYKLEIKNPALALLQVKGYSESNIQLGYFFINLIKEFDRYKDILYLFYDLLKTENIDILDIKNNVKDKFTEDEIEFQIFMRLKLSMLETTKENLYDYISNNYIKNSNFYEINDDLVIEHFIFKDNHKSIYKIGHLEFNFNSEMIKDMVNLKYFDEIILQNTIQYIGPLRYYPERNFILKDIEGDEYKSYSSEELWALLKNPKRSKVLNNLNEWLADEQKLKSHYEIIIKDNKIYFKDKRMDTLVSNKDLGLGISQILPILISSYYLKQKTVMIEQPELHLHPAVQAELADEIIKGYKKAGNRYFIESHSEYLLLRIMRRMRYFAIQKEGRDEKLDISNDDISLLYIDADEKNTYVKELKLSKSGKLLSSWPNGFFEEGFKERFE